MTTVIEIDGTKCQKCYSCVRQCPVKAIKVKDSQAEVVPERCINCGYCLSVCSQGARETKNYRLEVKNWSRGDGELVACLAPSFVASFTDCQPEQLVTALKELGFDLVYKVALGAKLIAENYNRYLVNSEQENLISTACPVVVNFIENRYPKLVPNLIPFVSPMIAMGQLLKNKNPEAQVVFIGPCIAKKSEMEIEGIGESIDAVLTFKDIKKMCREEGLRLNTLPQTKFNRSRLSHSDDFALSGGLVANLDDVCSEEVLITEGSWKCEQLLEGVLAGEIETKLLDILFCSGCIAGAEIDSNLSLFAREKLIKEYSQRTKIQEKDMNDGQLLIGNNDLDLERSFSTSDLEFDTPDEHEIKKILAYTNKITPGDELNCGACGYETCWEKAVAVHQGLAEIEMCLPYLLEQTEQEANYYKDKLSRGEETKYTFKDIKGKSVEIKEAKSKARQAAQTKSTILILGESGTGKEMFAHAIYNASPRCEGPFIKVNCAAITESLLEAELFGYEEGAFTGAKKGGKQGKFELADQGTIFLDEVGDMSLRMQAELLRVLQEGEIQKVGGNETINVDLRIIAATNRDLQRMVKEGEFREDLYYRLNVITINTPSLRSRIEDLPIIVEHIITKLTAEQRLSRKQLSQAALNKLMQYNWPGNVRELENVIIQTFSLTYEELIEVEHLPDYILQSSDELLSVVNDKQIQPLEKLTAGVEKQAIQKALNVTGWNKKKTAELLEISRSTLYQKIDEYNIENKKS